MAECAECARTINDTNNFTCKNCKAQLCGNCIDWDKNLPGERTGHCIDCGGNPSLNQDSKRFEDRTDVRFEDGL